MDKLEERMTPGIINSVQFYVRHFRLKIVTANAPVYMSSTYMAASGLQYIVKTGRCQIRTKYVRLEMHETAGIMITDLGSGVHFEVQ